MKKYFIIAATALLALSACTSEDFVDKTAAEKNETASNVMGFNVKNKNMSRATSLESTGQYNFGVWAVKQSGAEGSYTYQNVMENYLVGYHADGVGYAINGQSTWGPSDNLNDATSLWFYEGLGSDEYTNTTAPYILKTETEKMSNNAKQYLKYWDYSSSKVEFFAYAPYVKADAEATPAIKAVEFDYANKKLTVYNTDKVTMVAKTEVPKSNYKKDVSLLFKRLGASVKLKFWDDVPGYDVEMINYTLDGKTGVVAQGVITRTGGNYVYDFSTEKGSFSGTKEKISRTLEFAIPTGGEVTNVPANSIATGQPQYYKIGESSTTASASATEYPAQEVNALASPKENGDLTFHVSFKLHSLDTNETITVTNATVVVPESVTQWQNNTVYTYIFRITKDANGYTGGTTDPAGLYPIVFDQVKVADFDDETSNYTISATTVAIADAATDLAIATGANSSVSAEIGHLDAGSNKVLFTSTFVEVASFASGSEVASTETTCEGTPLTASATVYGRCAGTSVINAWCNGVKSVGRVVKVPLTITVPTTTWTAGTEKSETLTTNAPVGATVTWSTVTAHEKITIAEDGTVTVASTASAGNSATFKATYADARGVTQTAEITITVE